jgi:hypothetical protein
MVICGIEEVDFDFYKGDSSFESKDIDLALLHYPIQEILPREAKNVNFMDMVQVIQFIVLIMRKIPHANQQL